MDGEDHKTLLTSTGHEGHGVHLCHRCGWPFPNPHPSAKHRRAHKRVCGTIEGYEIVSPEEHHLHLAVSSTEYASDSDKDEHTPTPKLEGRTDELGTAAREGEKSNKSEDELFSDAVTEFSESGNSPQLEGSESAEGPYKSMKWKSLEGDFYGSKLLKLDETDDKANSETISDKAVHGLKTELVESKILVDNIDKYGDDGVHSQDRLAPKSLDAEGGKDSYHEVKTAARKEETCNKLIYEGEEQDLPPESEILQNLSTSVEVKSVADSAEESIPIKAVGGTVFAAGTVEKLGDSVGTKKIHDSTEEMGSHETIAKNELASVKAASDPIKLPDAVSVIPSIDKEVEQKVTLPEGGSAANIMDGNDGDCVVVGSEKIKLESSNSVEIAPTPEDDQAIKYVEKDVDKCEHSKTVFLETGDKKGESASVQVQALRDSTIPLDYSADFPILPEENVEVRHPEEFARTKCSITEPGSDNDLYEAPNSRMLQSGGSAEHDAEHHHVFPIPTTNLENPAASPLIPDLAYNAISERNVTELQPLDVGILTGVTDDADTIAALTSKPVTQTLAKSAEDDKSRICDLVSASESNHAVEGQIDDNLEGNAILEENPESTVPIVQLPLPQKKTLIESSTDTVLSGELNLLGYQHQSIITPKYNSIVSNGELTDKFDATTSEKCSLTPDSKLPIPLYINAQNLPGASALGDDKIKIDVEHAGGVDSKSLQEVGDDQQNKPTDHVSAKDLSPSSSNISDSLAGNWGSVSDTLETSSQRDKITNERAITLKSDDFEPPSFMTLVQSPAEASQSIGSSEIGIAQKNQQLKSDGLQAGWSPSLTNVVSESEGRKKNEEVIAKVTNWNLVKQHSNPLRNLLNDAKSLNTKQVPTTQEKDSTEAKDHFVDLTNVSSDLAPKYQDTYREEEWNSPEREPIEIKKEKKKKSKSFWAPLVCCTSVHRDL